MVLTFSNIAETKSGDDLKTLRELFERAVKYLDESFPGVGLSERILRHWAALEVHFLAASVSLFKQCIMNS